MTTTNVSQAVGRNLDSEFSIMSIKRISLLISLSIAVSLSPATASANTPGGGTGKGPDVAVKDNGDDTVTMSNGILSVTLQRSNFAHHLGQVHLQQQWRPSHDGDVAGFQPVLLGRFRQKSRHERRHSIWGAEVQLYARH